MSKVDIRATTAFHEAAHAVVAAHYGWWIIEPGSLIDSDFFTGMRCRQMDGTPAAKIAVGLAGELAARAHHGSNPICRCLSENDFEFLHGNIVDGWGEEEGDESEVLRVLIERYPAMRPPRLRELFNRLDRRTLRLIQRPQIWTRIDGLATTLIERGDLNATEVTVVMEGLECW